MADGPGVGPGNERGHWERWELVDVHLRILALFEHDFFQGRHALPLPEGWLDHPDLPPLRQELLEIAAKLVARGAPFGFKDPRTVRLLPLWKSILRELGVEPVFAVCLRKPAAVAYSLLQRDGFDPRYSEYLWAEYNFDCLLHTAEEVRELIVYDDWFDGRAANIHALLRLIGQPEALADTAESGVDSIVAHELRRSCNKSSVHIPLFDRMYHEIVAHFRGGGKQHLVSPATKQFGVIRQVNRGLETMLQLHTDRLYEIFEQSVSDLTRRCAELEAAATNDRRLIEALTAERDALRQAGASAVSP